MLLPRLLSLLTVCGLLAPLLWTSPAAPRPCAQQETHTIGAFLIHGTADDGVLQATDALQLRHTGPVHLSGSSDEGQSAAGRTGNPSPQPLGERSWKVWGINVLVGILLAVLALLLLVGPFVVLAVSLVMDGGCLRYGVFAAGWLLCGFGGTAVTLVIGLFAIEALGLSSDVFESIALVVISAYLFGYPVAAGVGRWWFRSLPRRRRRAWKQTLTGGALFGFGAGATAGLSPAMSGGFGGVGGGSFGGGGASGSWGASSAGKAAASASGTASPTAGASAGASASASGGAGLSVTGAAAGAATADGWWGRLRERWRRFRWYHGVAFVLAGLSFAALGAWVMAALQQKMSPGVVALGSLWAFGGYALWRWLIKPTSHPPDTDHTPDAEFQGGEASTSWS